MDRLSNIIRRQRELQTEYGYKYENMTLEERVATIKDMYVAATQELSEALNETSWKPWTVGSPFINEALTGELVDALQFMLNMLFCQYPELNEFQLAQLINEKHSKKVAINRKRLAEDYDGVSTKCPGCGRALDETPLHESFNETRGMYEHRCPCGEIISITKLPA